MNFIKKYIVPLMAILIGCTILNWLFSQIAMNYIIYFVNKILKILTLEDSIIYWFSEIIVFAIFGVMSFWIVIFVIYKLNKDIKEIPLISILLPMSYRAVFWIAHFMLISDDILPLLKTAPLQTLNIIISIVTIDIVFFALLIIQRKTPH